MTVVFTSPPRCWDTPAQASCHNLRAAPPQDELAHRLAIGPAFSESGAGVAQCCLRVQLGELEGHPVSQFLLKPIPFSLSPPVWGAGGIGVRTRVGVGDARARDIRMRLGSDWNEIRMGLG